MIRFFHALFVLFCLNLIGGLVVANVAAQTSETIAVEDTQITMPSQAEADIESAFRTIKRNEVYQYELADPIPKRPPSRFWRWVGDLLESIFKVLGPLLKIIFYLGIGGLVLGALYLIGRAIYETRFAKSDAEEAEEPEIPLYQPAQAQARILLDEIDRLAEEGRYGEAVHTLLFRSIQDIDRNRPNVVRRSLTAREIGELTVLTREARTAFSTIAGVSELAHFGGEAVNKVGFEIARAAYADLTGVAPAQARRRRS